MSYKVKISQVNFIRGYSQVLLCGFLNKMRFILKTILLLLFAVNTLNAQHDHSSHDHSGGMKHSHTEEPPHGGEIKDVGKYHLEILFDIAAPVGEKMSIYILKSNLKTLNSSEAKGSISIKYKNGQEENYELNSNTDKLYCDVKDIVNSFNAIIKILYKGKEYSCAYYYKGMK